MYVGMNFACIFIKTTLLYPVTDKSYSTKKEVMRRQQKSTCTFRSTSHSFRIKSYTLGGVSCLLFA